MKKGKTATRAKPKRRLNESKQSAAAARKPQTPRPSTSRKKEWNLAGRVLDQASRDFDVAVEKLRGQLDSIGECLHELLAAEARRERQRRFTILAEAGVLHDLQSLAAALENLTPEQLSPSLNGVSRYAQLALSHLMRAFEVLPIHKSGQELIVMESQFADYDWSSGPPGDRVFPLGATVVRCGWKCGSEVLVKAKVAWTGIQVS